ncbi:hypothetical protein [Candidatus Poriferisocius sp.]|uniref:hypothetical protein n=1 Tax=Candidatus Poriferisocius sp. TaxID=3101276 RepID=UPI003B5C9EED
MQRRGGGEAAQAQADAQGRRPKVAKLAADAVLRQQVQERLDGRLSPHDISAELTRCGFRVCAETIYQGCYGYAGLKPGSWKKRPRNRQRRKPRGAASGPGTQCCATTGP